LKGGELTNEEDYRMRQNILRGFTQTLVNLELIGDLNHNHLHQSECIRFFGSLLAYYNIGFWNES
jgi:hypothetical protein